MSAASMARPYRGEQPAGATSIGDIVDETQFEELMTRLADVRRTRPLAPSGAARTLHRWILRHFGDTATAPPPEVVKEWAIELDVNLRDLLTQLIRLELIDADPDTTRVSGAYPFAENDHGHGVTVAGVHVVHAYCATGALGISALLGRDVSITSTDPGTGQEVRVQVLGQRASWQPSQCPCPLWTASFGVTGRGKQATCSAPPPTSSSMLPPPMLTPPGTA